MRVMLVLRQSTAELHHAIERLPLMTRLMSSDVTCHDYVAYLRSMADVYGTLESSLLGALDAEIRGQLGVTPKLPSILQDLAAHDPSRRPLTRTACAPIGSDAALGGLYVLEGATLGGRVIAKQLRRSLGPALGESSFLDFHGEQAAAAWKRFGAVLDDLTGRARSDPREVVGGARGTFSIVYGILARAAGARHAEPPDLGTPGFRGRRRSASAAARSDTPI